jgi:hypothetical protein
MTMSTPEMDYFTQKPELDLRAFFEGKGVSMSEADTTTTRPTVPGTGAAPPPKDTYWVAETVGDAEEE